MQDTQINNTPKPLKKRMTFAQIQEKAAKDRISLVQDDNIFFILLPKEDNQFDYDFIKQYHECLDIIEKSKGPAIMATVNLGGKTFSSGFNLDVIKSSTDPYELPVLMQQLLARILVFPIPTACIFDGIAVAGGLIFGLVFDFRIIREEKAFVQLNELNVGIGLMPGFAAIIRNQLDSQMARLLIYGKRYKSEQSRKMKIVQKIYRDEQDMINLVSLFYKEFGHLGGRREALYETKINMHYDTYKMLKELPPLKLATLNNEFKL
eukprot:403377372